MNCLIRLCTVIGLKGFQNDWRILRYINNEVYFSNLPYDSYQLEVELSDGQGIYLANTGKGTGDYSIASLVDCLLGLKWYI